MPPGSTCPDPKTLEKLILGRIPTTEAEPLELHVADCPRCAVAISRIGVADPLVEAVRTAQDTELNANQEQAQAIIPWLKRLRPKDTTKTIPSSAPREDATLPPAPLSAGEATIPPSACAENTPPYNIDQANVPTKSLTTFDFLTPAQGPDEIGRLGPYQVLKALGAGGMGMVFLAHDPLLKRQIALKVIKPELVERGDVRARFLQEAQAIAAIEHDNIVAIFQVGEDRGAPFLAMPLLRGESLEDRLQSTDGPLPLADCLRFGREIAAGLAAAHDRGLVHRDIKPGNIWLEARDEAREKQRREARVDGRGANDVDFSSSLASRRSTLDSRLSTLDSRVKILDFGLAQAMQDAEAEQGKILGTPTYMAPEQGQGQPTDARADLFSLGCVMYRMTTGKSPFQGGDVIRTLYNVATMEPPAPRELNPTLPPALALLIMKLLAKKPEQRPASAQAVAQAIQAIEETLRPKPSRWRWYLATAAAVVAGIGLTVALLPNNPEPLPPEEPVEVTFTYDEPDLRLILQRGDDPAQEIDLKNGVKLMLMPGDYRVGPLVERKGRKMLPDHLVVKPGEPLPVELRLVGEINQVAWQPRPVRAVALVAKKGRLLALAGSEDSTVQLWNVFDDKETQRLDYEPPNPVLCLAISADGRFALVAGGGKGRPGSKRPTRFPIQLWDLDNPRQPLATLHEHDRKVTALAFAPDGKHFLSATDDGQLYLWDINKQAVLFKEQAHDSAGIYSMAFSPSGKQALTGGGDNRAILWEISPDAQPRKIPINLEKHTKTVSAVAFAPTGTQAASASWDGVIRVWDLKTGKFRDIPGHAGAVNTIAYAPDGQRLLSGGDDGSVRLWETASGKELYRFMGHHKAVYSVAFSADGRRALSGGTDQKVRLWALPK